MRLRRAVLRLVCVAVSAVGVLAADAKAVFSDYHEAYLKLFPMEATLAGDNRYNDLLPNPLSEEHRAAVKELYAKTLARLKEIDRGGLKGSEQVSYDTLKWECEVTLANLEFPTHLVPINQFHSLNLDIATWAGGTSAQPFKTVKDY
jgi:uncharacterized protein (DUF885 family)